jgi:hypothetical protein
MFGFLFHISDLIGELFEVGLVTYTHILRYLPFNAAGINEVNGLVCLRHFMQIVAIFNLAG